MEEKTKVDLVPYSCAECGGKEWTLKVGHCDDGRTFLYVICANKECQEERRREYNITDDSTPLIWDEFDITGQGKDPQDIGGITGEGHLN